MSFNGFSNFHFVLIFHQMKKGWVHSVRVSQESWKKKMKSRVEKFSYRKRSLIIQRIVVSHHSTTIVTLWNGSPVLSEKLCYSYNNFKLPDISLRSFTWISASRHKLTPQRHRTEWKAVRHTNIYSQEVQTVKLRERLTRKRPASLSFIPFSKCHVKINLFLRTVREENFWERIAQQYECVIVLRTRRNSRGG